MSKKIIIANYVLLALGLLMIYSASSVWAEYKYNNQFYYLIRQFIFVLLGQLCFLFFCKFDYKRVLKYLNILMLIGYFLLIIVLIPGIGLQRGGSRSWIGFAAITVQPSEIMKFILIIYYAYILSKNFEKTDKLWFLIKSLIPLFVALGLIMLEPDFGSAVVILLTIALMYLMSNIKLKWIIYVLIVGIVGASVLIMIAPYRMDRITSYLDPYKDPLGSGFQIIQSYYAYIPNTLFGRGLFNSIQKYYYLPEPQTDFIFAIIIEELGILGIFLVLGAFFTIFINGVKVSFKHTNLFYKYLSIGITASLFVQVFINLSVVIGLIPVTGVTLPFLSYGGSSLLISLSMTSSLVGLERMTDENRIYRQ